MFINTIGTSRQKACRIIFPATTESGHFSLLANLPQIQVIILNSNIDNISYQLENVLPVKLEVFDLQGRLIQLVKQEIQQPGNYTMQFNQSNLTNGTYIFSLKAGNKAIRKKIIVLK